MAKLFLGKWWHWAFIIAFVAVLWLAGSKRMHVIEFNNFVLGLLGFVGVAIVSLLLGTRPGEQVTRDAIRADPVDSIDLPGDRHE